MRRVICISSVMVILDQMLRFIAQHFLTNLEIGNEYFGFTYRKNYGMYLYPNAKRGVMAMIAIIFLLILFGSYYVYKYCCERRIISIRIDISYALFIAAILGNIYIDRIVFGYVRDYIRTPIAIANLADIIIYVAIGLLLLEIILNKEFYVFLKQDCKLKNVRLFLKYIRNNIKKLFCGKTQIH